jgi:hypothetical protein
MGDWTKIIYDKLPMFYGQLMINQYVQDPALSFCAIGDATCDSTPLQVTEFGQGHSLDQLLNKVYLEGGGGGNITESYELAAYFYLKHSDVSQAALPYMFITGDEAFYDKVSKDHIKEVIGSHVQKDADSKKMFDELKKKYNLFLLHKPYSESHANSKIITKWQNTLGKEHILELVTPKACIDVMLGAISIVSEARTLQAYIEDMKDRGQDQNRIDEVTRALLPLNNAITKKTFEKVENKDIAPFVRPQEEIVQPTDEIEKLLQEFKKSLGIQPAPKRNNSIEIPDDYLCPITQELLDDPVITSDGQTYERFAIEKWLLTNNTSPLTNAPLDNKTLISNVLLRKVVSDFKQKNGL